MEFDFVLCQVVWMRVANKKIYVLYKNDAHMIQKQEYRV